MITPSRRAAAAVLAAGSLVLGSTIVSPVTSAAAATRSTGTRVVGLPSSGHRVTLMPGQKLKIDLRTASDGGYRWVITKLPGQGSVRLLAKNVKPYPHKKGTVGFPSHTIYLLRAVGPGSTSIRLAERPAGSASPVAQRYTLRIRVAAPAPKPVPVQQHSCTLTSSGSCIRGGEFCPQADYGQSGWDGSGRRYVCTGDATHPHWETP